MRLQGKDKTNVGTGLRSRVLIVKGPFHMILNVEKIIYLGQKSENKDI